MVLSGRWLCVALAVLALWFLLLYRTCWKALRKSALDRRRSIRERLNLAGIALATVAVGSLLVLHLTWTSVAISQHLGVLGVKIISMFIFWPTLAGLLLSTVGSGRIKYIGIGTSFVTGLWWFSFLMAGAISMGASIARHPTKFLVPEGYVGWVEVKYGELNSPALQRDSGIFICEIPDDGLLSTSSQLEAGWAKDEYFDYSKDGSVHPLKETEWGRGGMIWGGTDEWQLSTGESKPHQINAYVYIGTEEQYHHAVSRKEIRPFNESKDDRVVR